MKFNDAIKIIAAKTNVRRKIDLIAIYVMYTIISINASNEDYDINGYICKPSILKSNRNHMTTIVNGRIVKNTELNKTINDAYYTYKPDIKYPIVVINIETDPTIIDVNIHPTKQDIKFSKQFELKELVTETIKDALYKALLIPIKEAILILKDIKDKKENTIDTKIFGDSGRKELRIDSYAHSVTDEELKNVITKLQRM